MPLTITTTGTWQAGAKLTYQWRVNGVVIKGANTASYVPLPADITKVISVTVFGAKPGLTTARLTASTANPVVKGTFTTAPIPVITAAKVGYPASVSLGTWAPKPTSYTYQWALNGADIVGATKATYVPSGTDLLGTLTVKVTAVRAGFNNSTVVSDGKVVANGVFATTAKPKVTGVARVGRVLTATTPAWSPWRPASRTSGDSTVRSSPEPSTTSTPSRRTALGGRLTVTVTGTRLGFVTANETSNPTAVVTP